MGEKTDGVNNDMPMPPKPPEGGTGESQSARLMKVDMDTLRNRVTNLLERMEPRVALIERVLLDAAMLDFNDKGQIVKAAPKIKEEPRKKRRYNRNVTKKVTREKRK
jgi:hypothetical protein